MRERNPAYDRLKYIKAVLRQSSMATVGTQGMPNEEITTTFTGMWDEV